MGDPVSLPAAAPRSAWRLVGPGPFGALFWGKVCANSGSWMHTVVAAITLFEVTGSAAAVSLVSVAQFAPQLVLTPLSGRWADAGDVLRQMVVARCLCTAGSAALALVVLVPQRAPAFTVVAVFACSVVVGVGFAVGGPPMQAAVSDLVAPEELRTAMALNTVPITVGRVVGPVLGASAAATLAPAVAFGLAAFLQLVLVLLLLGARFPAFAPAVAGGASASVGEGLRYLRSDRTAVLVLLATVAVGVGSEPTLTLAPSLASAYGGGEGLVGWLTFAFGAGAMLGALLASSMSAWLREEVGACVGLLALAAGSLVVALSSGPPLALVGYAVGGLGFSWGAAGFGSLVQRRTHRAYRGRVMALWLVAFIGFRPVAAAGCGLVLAAAFTCRPSALTRPTGVPDVA
jgi:MFS family permease